MRPSGLARLVLGLLVAAIMQANLGLSAQAQEFALADADALIRFVHAAPTTPALDLYVDGALVVQGLAFGAATDILISVPSGPRPVSAGLAGAERTVVAEGSLDLAPGATYEVALVGLDEGVFFEVYPVETGAPGDGAASIRLIVSAPDADSVALVADANWLMVDGIAFPGASGYVEIGSGSYDLALNAAGAGQEVTVELGSVAFEAGAIYDLFVVGLIADGSLWLLIVRA
jgi:Domain of unknown function (DUF4397)